MKIEMFSRLVVAIVACVVSGVVGFGVCGDAVKK